MKKHVCKQCGKAYEFDGLLQRHKCKSGGEEHFHFDLNKEQSPAVHERKKFHRCLFCEKKFATKDSLATHAWMQHPAETNSEGKKVRFFFYRRKLIENNFINHIF